MSENIRAACARRVLPAKYLARTGRGTTVPIQVFHAGPPPRLNAQYNATITKISQSGMCPTTAAMIMGTKLSVCSPAARTTHRLCDPNARTALGPASWSSAPASKGTDPSRPASVSPIPTARAKATKYASPHPTMTENNIASRVLKRRSRRI